MYKYKNVYKRQYHTSLKCTSGSFYCPFTTSLIQYTPKVIQKIVVPVCHNLIHIKQYFSYILLKPQNTYFIFNGRQNVTEQRYH